MSHITAMRHEADLDLPRLPQRIKDSDTLWAEGGRREANIRHETLSFSYKKTTIRRIIYGLFYNFRIFPIVSGNSHGVLRL